MSSTPTETVIELQVDAATGNFTIAPTTCVTGRGHRVKWFSNDGPFVVHFNRRTPFSRALFHSAIDADGSFHRVPPDIAEVELDAPSGIYEYAVGIFKEGRVFIHSSGEVRVTRPFP